MKIEKTCKLLHYYLEARACKLFQTISTNIMSAEHTQLNPSPEILFRVWENPRGL